MRLFRKMVSGFVAIALIAMVATMSHAQDSANTTKSDTAQVTNGTNPNNGSTTATPVPTPTAVTPLKDAVPVTPAQLIVQARRDLERQQEFIAHFENANSALNQLVTTDLAGMKPTDPGAKAIMNFRASRLELARKMRELIEKEAQLIAGIEKQTVKSTNPTGTGGEEVRRTTTANPPTRN